MVWFDSYLDDILLAFVNDAPLAEMCEFIRVWSIKSVVRFMCRKMHDSRLFRWEFQQQHHRHRIINWVIRNIRSVETVSYRVWIASHPNQSGQLKRKVCAAGRDRRRKGATYKLKKTNNVLAIIHLSFETIESVLLVERITFSESLNFPHLNHQAEFISSVSS